MKRRYEHQPVASGDKIKILRPDGTLLFTIAAHQRLLAEEILANRAKATRHQSIDIAHRSQ